MRAQIGFLVVFLLLLALNGCAQVEPWEKGHFAKPQMQSRERQLQRAARTHIQNSREAATGGDVAAGGGCGCY